MDDLELLVERARAGDPDAFGRLYAGLARAVLLHLVALLGSQDDAEDALQATFFKAWRTLPQLRHPARFKAWLFRIARNTGLDLVRRRRREPRGRPMEGLEVLGVTEAEWDRREVRRLVAQLRPETRSLVLLRAVQGWSAEEVADALGLHPATVRRRYARALEHLRARLERSMSHDRRA